MECPRPPARPRQPAHHPVLSAPCAFPLKARYFLFRARPRLPARTYIFRRQRSGAAGPTSRSPPVLVVRLLPPSLRDICGFAIAKRDSRFSPQKRFPSSACALQPRVLHACRKLYIQCTSICAVPACLPAWPAVMHQHHAALGRDFVRSKFCYKI